MRTRRAGKSAAESELNEVELPARGVDTPVFVAGFRLATRPEELIGRLRRFAVNPGPGASREGSAGGRGAFDAGTAKRKVDPEPGSEATSVVNAACQGSSRSMHASSPKTRTDEATVKLDELLRDVETQAAAAVLIRAGIGCSRESRQVSSVAQGSKLAPDAPWENRAKSNLSSSGVKPFPESSTPTIHQMQPGGGSNDWPGEAIRIAFAGSGGAVSYTSM